VINEDAHQTLDPIVEVEKATPLLSTVYQVYRPVEDEIRDELGHDPAVADLFLVHAIEAGANPVEWTKDRVVEVVLQAVRVNHPIQQLLPAAVNPAMLVDRAEDEVRCLLIELFVLRTAV